MDNDLYTGVDVTDNDTLGNEAPNDTQQQAMDEQKSELSKLLPGVEEILKTIDEEKLAVADIRAYISKLGEKPSGDQIEREYRARELYIGFLDRLATNIQSRVGTAQEMTNG